MFYSYQSKEEWVEWICQWQLYHTSTTIVTLMEEDCSRVAATNKQTGLQGDGEDFSGWNQCAYYETAGISGPDDELRARRNHRPAARTHSNAPRICGVTSVTALINTPLITTGYLLPGRQSARSGGRPGEPTRRCTWSRSVWLGWSGRSASPACSSQCTHLPAPPGSEVTGRRRRREGWRWLHAPSLLGRKEKRF